MGLNEGIVDGNNLDIIVLNAIVRLSEDEASEPVGYRVLTHFGRPGFELAIENDESMLLGTYDTSDTTEAVDSNFGRHVDG